MILKLNQTETYSGIPGLHICMWPTTPQPCSSYQSSNSREVLQDPFSKPHIRILWHIPIISCQYLHSGHHPYDSFHKGSNFYTKIDWISQNWQLLMQTVIHAPLITLVRVCNFFISSKQLACTSVVGKWHCPLISPLRYHYIQSEPGQDSCPWVSEGSFLSLFLVSFKSALYIKIIRENQCSDNTNKKLHLVLRWDHCQPAKPKWKFDTKCSWKF